MVPITLRSSESNLHVELDDGRVLILLVLFLLAPFLSAEYGLTASECGLILMIVGTVYLIFTPVLGYLMDHGFGGLAMLILGNFFITVAFIFIGPIHLFKPISGNLWLTGLAMGINKIFSNV